jgi:hypothetical protein
MGLRRGLWRRFGVPAAIGRISFEDALSRIWPCIGALVIALVVVAAGSVAGGFSFDVVR